jgi:zinc D-Ala-D-Ala carboxypeptidase
MKLSEHFTAEELGVARASIDAVENARALCEQVLECVRARFGNPVVVHCGMRSAQHNKAVGGKAQSWHLFEGGRAAADFHVAGEDTRRVFDWMRLESDLPFDKVILESAADGTPACIHVQMDRVAEPRRLAYTGRTGAGTMYRPEVVA